MKTNHPERIGVIGSGLAGLSAACVLAARGYSVLLLERNAWLGGKATLWEKDGFRFDMGPTILTLPSVLRRVFGEAGRRMEDYLELVPLDPQWRCFFEDGSVLDLQSDVEAMSQTVASYSKRPGGAEEYRKFMELSRKLHEISDRHFFWRPIGGLRDMFDRKSLFTPRTLLDVMSMRMGSTMGGTVRAFIKDPRVAQMIDHFTQYVGSAPDASPAVLCGIGHMQSQEGIWYPKGGIHAVPQALVRLAQHLGVEFRTQCGVKQILTRQGRVSGILTEQGETIPVSAVVSNADAVRTYRELLAPQAAPKPAKTGFPEPACSGVVLYLGLKKRYDHLLHHNFVFSRSPEVEFEDIYRRGEPAADPTCYLCSPAQTEPDTAPAGGDALYVLVHAPYLRPHHDWSRMLPDYRRTILNKLKRTAGLEDIEERIVVEHALTPRDIHERYRVLNGAIYGVASHGRLFGAFKTNNRSRALPGLYLAGGAAHPGPGMPMVLMSGWIAADALDQDGLSAKTPRRASEPCADSKREFVSA